MGSPYFVPLAIRLVCSIVLIFLSGFCQCNPIDTGEGQLDTSDFRFQEVATGFDFDCEDEFRKAKETEMRAKNITCFTGPPHHDLEIRKQQPKCVTPFLYNPGGGSNFNVYYACKPVEKGDEFVIEGDDLHECEPKADGELLLFFASDFMCDFEVLEQTFLLQNSELIGSKNPTGD